MALMQLSCKCSNTGKKLLVKNFVAPWTDVYFNGKKSNLRTKIEQVVIPGGVISSPLLPARLLLADKGVKGDSGALIRDSNDDEAVGIYLGGYNSPSNKVGGIAQHVFQITKTMDLDILPS